MAIHDDYLSMIREALPEYLELARIGVAHRKANGGVLGYPSATCLFAIVDAIGSYHRGDPSFTVHVDGKPMTIKETSDHILILNAFYFGLTLTDAELRALYRLSRCPLTHNALLAARQWLWVGEPTRPAIESKDDGIHIYLPALLGLCEQAVERFLAVAVDVVPGSTALAEIQGKVTRYEEQKAAAVARIASAPADTTSAQATAIGRSPDR